jgi:hypothetical protein
MLASLKDARDQLDAAVEQARLAGDEHKLVCLRA